MNGKTCGAAAVTACADRRAPAVALDPADRHRAQCYEIFQRAFSVRWLASMERPKLNLSLGPDAALIFMKGIGIPPRTKKSRVEKWEWQTTVCTLSATMGISSTPEHSPAITIPTQSSGQSS
jgi:hypothetical protein